MLIMLYAIAVRMRTMHSVCFMYVAQIIESLPRLEPSAKSTALEHLAIAVSVEWYYSVCAMSYPTLRVIADPDEHQ